MPRWCQARAAANGTLRRSTAAGYGSMASSTIGDMPDVCSTTGRASLRIRRPGSGRPVAIRRIKQRRNAERDLAAIDRKIAGVITMGEKGGDPRALALRLNELEAERRALLAQVPSGKETDAIALHPNAAERYRQKVAHVHAALTKGDEASREAITLVRELIERIT